MPSDAKDVRELSDEALARLVEETVRQFLKDEGGAENALEIGADDELWAQFDSLLIMELVVHLEQRFAVQINTASISPQDMKTIGRICALATKAIRAAASG